MYYITNYIHRSKLEENINDKSLLDLDTNLFIDLRSNVPNFYNVELSVLVSEQEQSKKLCIRKTLDSFCRFIDFHIKNLNNPSFYFFVDFGESKYHKSISSSYKKNRRQSNATYSRRQYELMQNNINYIIKVISEFFSDISNVYFIELNNLESDFVPYYMMYKGLIQYENKLNITLSSDKDLMQNLEFKNNIFIPRSNSKNIIIIDNTNWLSYISVKQKVDLDITFLPLILSIGGDKSDNIIGIKGIGLKTIGNFLQKYFKDDKFTNLDDFINLLKSKTYTSARDTKIVKSIIDNRSIIETNIKLISFKLLSDSTPARIFGLIKSILTNKDVYSKQDFIDIVRNLIHKDAKYPNIESILE